MSSLEPFVHKIKPALDTFLRDPNKKNLEKLDHELRSYDWMNLKIFNVQILVPLTTKLEQLTDQDIKTGTINCIRFVTSKIYLKDVSGLCALMMIVLKQIFDVETATLKPDMSEEIKLAAVESIAETLRRSTTDVLEAFYVDKSASFCGELLVLLVHLIEKEKYRKLVMAAIECLMAIFYVHDEADFWDVVLRNQVANTVFLFLPKVLLVLQRTTLAEETRGVTLKALAVKALGRILCIMYDETNESLVRSIYDKDAFKDVLQEIKKGIDNKLLIDDDIFGPKSKNKTEIEKRAKRLKEMGRSARWFSATSRKLNMIFRTTNILRSHESTKIRYEYANMCCTLMTRCAFHLKDNFIYMLENVIALSEDEDADIRNICRKVLQQLQSNHNNECIFDESSEILFDEHLMKLPRIIMRCDDAEQYAELVFLKAFLQNLSANKLQLLLSFPKNLEMFCMCLLTAVSLNVSRKLMIEEYTLKEMNENDLEEAKKLNWRQFKNLNSKRCIETLKEICIILGKTKYLNRMIYDFFLELLAEANKEMNETLLIMLWMAAEKPDKYRENRKTLVVSLLDELLDQQHWHLALKPDNLQRLKIDKPTNLFIDRTPGLYESAYEVRMQDYDSDEENDDQNVDECKYVTLVDTQFNVMHTCIVLDALGHCATFSGDAFDSYVFRTLHNVLLKAASSNSIIYQAAIFALTSIQKALHFHKLSEFIGAYTDFIAYHLNMIFKRTPESKSAVDILTVLLQFGQKASLPHLDNIFQTIFIECSKVQQSENLISYLKVFNSFLSHANRWKINCDNEIENAHEMEIDNEQQDNELVSEWLQRLETTPTIDGIPAAENETTDKNKEEENENEKVTNEYDETTKEDTKQKLPAHIETVKEIMQQVVKLLTSREKAQQILSLECLIVGLPLMQEYENEFLPLVHLLWQPLIEKFRQQDAVVLNRCFTLLNVLATHAKDFILKRSLNDVIPFLKQFLEQSAAHSAAETITAHTQEYKLQLKLLKEFPNLLQNMQIDGKHLNDICEIVVIYLSASQPKELQDAAAEFFKILKFYNGPLMYLVVMKRSHMKEFQENVKRIFVEYGFKT